MPTMGSSAEAGEGDWVHALNNAAEVESHNKEGFIWVCFLKWSVKKYFSMRYVGGFAEKIVAILLDIRWLKSRLEWRCGS